MPKVNSMFNSSSLDTYNAVLGVKSSPVALANSINSAHQEQHDYIATAVGTLQSVNALVNLAKQTPFGTPLTLSSLTNNLHNADKELTSSRYITDATLYSIASDVTSLVGTATLAVAATTGAALSAPVALTVTTLSVVVSTGLGVMALSSGTSNDISDTVMNMYDRVVNLGRRIKDHPDVSAEASHHLAMQMKESLSKTGSVNFDFLKANSNDNSGHSQSNLPADGSNQHNTSSLSSERRDVIFDPNQYSQSSQLNFLNQNSNRSVSPPMLAQSQSSNINQGHQYSPQLNSPQNSILQQTNTSSLSSERRDVIFDPDSILENTNLSFLRENTNRQHSILKSLNNELKTDQNWSNVPDNITSELDQNTELLNFDKYIEDANIQAVFNRKTDNSDLLSYHDLNQQVENRDFTAPRINPLEHQLPTHYTDTTNHMDASFNFSRVNPTLQRFDSYIKGLNQQDDFSQYQQYSCPIEPSLSRSRRSVPETYQQAMQLTQALSGFDDALHVGDHTEKPTENINQRMLSSNYFPSNK